MTNLTSSIVIPTKNRPRDLINCLKSIKKQTILPQEIIIVDSSSKSLKQNIAFNRFFTSNNFPQTKLIYKRSASGTAKQRNIGINLTTQELIYFLDDDTTLDPLYLETLQHYFKQNSTYVGGMCDYKQNGNYTPFITKLIKKTIKLQPIIKKIFFLQHDYGSGKVSLAGFARHPYGTKKFKFVKALGGCCVYKKNILRKYKFDENLEKLGPYAYMEDFDLSYRIAQENLLFFAPTKLITHKMSPINRHNTEKNRLNYIYNYSYLFFKNIYPQNKLKIIIHYWSILGLFIEAITLFDKEYIKGYAKGLYYFYFKNF